MESIRVLVRVRPVISDGKNAAVSAVKISNDNKTISIDANRKVRNWPCDFVFGPKATQFDVYQNAKYVIEAALDGYNGTIFAYGQTGSGKTYSMFGKDGKINNEPGIVPRCVQDIFQRLEASRSRGNSSVHVSFLQVYNDQVYDLFQKGPMVALNIREKDGDVFVSNLKQYRTYSVDQCITLIETGLQNRTVRETAMNHASSRSHSILQILLEQNVMLENNEWKRIRSKLNLVDLAGSERWVLSDMTEEQISELTNINSSLYTLGRCIAVLAKKSHGENDMHSPDKHLHVPFRDSKLTRLLKDSIGGNCKTCLLATVNPSLTCGDESICTLRFADRAHQVMSIAAINEDECSEADTQVKSLQNEIRRLNHLLELNGVLDPKQGVGTSPPEISPLPDAPIEHKCEHISFIDKATMSTQRCLHDIPTISEVSLTNDQRMTGGCHLFEGIEDGLASSDTFNASVPKEHGERIIRIMGSILNLVESFLASASVEVKPIITKNCERKKITSRLNKEGTCGIVGEGAQELNKAVVNDGMLETNSVSSKKTSALGALLSKRKQLKTESKKSPISDDEQILNKQLSRALRKKSKKVQLREWLLLKELEAEKQLL